LEPNKKKLWKILLIIFLFFLPIVVLLGYGGDRGLIRLYHAEMERQAYIEKIRNLIKENEELQREVQRLRSDMKHIESVARKELNLIKENEIIYRFKKDETYFNSLESEIPENNADNKNKQHNDGVAKDGDIE